MNIRTLTKGDNTYFNSDDVVNIMEQASEDADTDTRRYLDEWIEVLKSTIERAKKNHENK